MKPIRHDLHFDHPRSLLQLFEVGMNRETDADLFARGDLGKPWLNLGAGRKYIKDCLALDLERGWKAPFLNFEDETVGGIYAIHFFEHLPSPIFEQTVGECQRVLAPGCPLNVVVPHWKGELAYEDPTHVRFFTEGTFENLFNNSYYGDRQEWKLYVNFSLIIGLVERNLALVTQLVKR